MDSDSDSYGQPQRRTRGRQITYAESDDSEEVNRIVPTIKKIFIKENTNYGIYKLFFRK